MSDAHTPPEGFEPDDLFERATRRARHRRRLPAHLRPSTPFIDLPRPRRRGLAASLGWRIRSDPNGRGVFTTHDILPGSREWTLEAGQVSPVHWADALFLSTAPLRHGRFFNATVQTAALVAARQIIDQATGAVEEAMSPQDRERRFRTYKRRTPQGITQMWFSPDPLLESLGGLTAAGARARWLRDHWDNWPGLVEVSVGATFEPGYAYGQGLQMVVDELGLDCDALVRAIARFRDRGERAFRDPPMDFSTRRAIVEALLGVHLWRWDTQQARAEGRGDPEPPPELVQELFHHESNAVRL